MDKKYYAELVSKYIDNIYRVALNSCSCREDAEDATQNAFMKLLNCDKEFKTDEDVKRWLIRVVINECHNIFRSSWNKKTISLEEITVENGCAMTDNIELIDILQKLPANYRQILYLYYFEEYSIKEISKITGKSESGIQNTLMRARKCFKEKYKEA